MAPPAKRRRRNTVQDSDGEGHQPRASNTLAGYLVSSPNSPAKPRIPASPPSPAKDRAGAGTPSGAASPSRARRAQPPRRARDAGKKEEKSKTADLKALFSKQAQRATRAGAGSDTRGGAVDDIASDPISEDDDISERKASSSSLVGQHARKRLRHGADAVSAEAPSASQRFLRPPKPASAEALNDDLRPWSERFGPRNLDELAVHKKKVADVRRWLEGVMAGRLRQRVLILKGAAGSGKTTTVRLLAHDMGCELLEWKNPSPTFGTGFVSSSAQFDDFLGRGGKFGALDIEDPAPSTPSSSNGVAQDRAKRIILIEEFPNTFSRSSSALTSFRSSILQYLAAHAPSLPTFGEKLQLEPIKPVVLSISETLLTTTSASADSMTAHRLLGSEILHHPSVAVIEFNPIAPTLLAKALDLLVQKEARKSGRRRTPGPLVLKQLGEIGDIRSAISSLEFLCLKGDREADWGAKVTFAKQTRGARDSIGLTRGETESLELITQREASLGIFHAVGKVVYNKRDEAPAADNTVEDLPPHLSRFARPRPSQVPVDTLIDETGTDTHTFISALHENYILSCESTGPMDLSTPTDYVNECIEYLSLSDLLCPSRDVFFGGRGGFSGRDSGSHLLRQDEMTFQVAVRGLLFSLPNPVKRKTTTTVKGSDAFRMFYPTGLKLWRAKEEIESLVDAWSSKVLRGEALPATRRKLADGAHAFRKPPAPPGDAPRTQRLQQGPTPRDNNGDHAHDGPPPPLLSLGSAARREMLLDRLPYMAHLARARKTAAGLRDLEKVVAFQGVAAPDDESDANDDDDHVPSGEAWATDRPADEASPRKRGARIKPAGAVSSMLAQKLVLSDDDIED